MDLNILQNRNYLDTKRFYKSSSIDKKNPGVLQLGTVIEGSHEYYSNRYTNKERSQTFIQEVMKDNKINHYATQKYKTMQQQQTIKSQQQRQRRTKSPLLSTSADKNASNKKPIFKKSQNQKRWNYQEYRGPWITVFNTGTRTPLILYMRRAVTTYQS